MMLKSALWEFWRCGKDVMLERALPTSLDGGGHFSQWGGPSSAHGVGTPPTYGLKLWSWRSSSKSAWVVRTRSVQTLRIERHRAWATTVVPSGPRIVPTDSTVNVPPGRRQNSVVETVRSLLSRHW